MVQARQLCLYTQSTYKLDGTNSFNRDYMSGGRFTLAYNIQQSFMDNFFLQVWVSKLVNEQWQ